MPTPLLNSKYQTYTIAESEFLESHFVSPAHRAKLQNDLVDAIEQKLGLAPNDMSASSKESYWQQEAYLRGQIDYIHSLLDSSDAAEKQAALSNVPDSIHQYSDNAPL